MIPRAVHVWVTDAQVWGDRQSPGLLLGWDRGPSGEWLGWVILAETGIDAQSAGPYVRQVWLPADRITERG